MKKIYIYPIYLILLISLIGLDRVIAQDTIVLQAMKDNSLFEEGDLSNGAGQFLFVGKTNLGNLRRALIAFDIASYIPAGSNIESVFLTLHLSKTGSGSSPIYIHELFRDWGEGTSDAPLEEGAGTAATVGDATWLSSFYNTETWSHPGGDYDTTVLATTDVNSIGDYTWGSTTGMIDNVQTWLDNPDENFGWILIGKEVEPHDTKRFDSRELENEPFRPRMKVVYSAPNSLKRTLDDFQVITGSHVYPNPFSEIMTIEYILNRINSVEIKVMNILGQEVVTLVDEYQSIGTQTVTWDGMGGNGKKLNNGVYYAYIRVGEELSVLKILKTQ